MKIVPFAERKESFGKHYGIPGGPENSSYVAIECEVDNKTTLDDIFKILDKEIARVRALDDDDELFRIYWNLAMRGRGL